MKDFQGHFKLGKKAQGQDTTDVINTNHGFSLSSNPHSHFSIKYQFLIS